MVCHPLFRSEEVSLYQIFLQYDFAYETTVNLGEAGIVEFLDLHLLGTFHTRQFTQEVDKCDDIARRIDGMRRELQKEGVIIEEPENEPVAPYMDEIYDTESTTRFDDERSLSLFWKLDKDLKAMDKNAYSIKRDFLKYIEYKHVMMKTEPLFEKGPKTLSDSLSRLLLEDVVSGIKTVGFVAGVILSEKVHVFERIIWRLCQGNVLFSHAAIDSKIEDPDTGTIVLKSVFYAIYQGKNLEEKVMKVCEGFKANIYYCPVDSEERKEVMIEIKTAIDDLDEILTEANEQRKLILETVSRNVTKWSIMACKAKATFNVMNKYQRDKMRKVYIAECWVPANKFNQLKKVLLMNKNELLMDPVVVKILTDEEPPTFNDLNKFTRVFQDLINAYGANSYQEHNPAPYYIITFPFLFSIMFGDAGHGVIMTLAALFMLYNEVKWTKNTPGGEIGRIFFAGRYIVLLMGLFSIQSGLLYNDVFSKTTHFFNSGWKMNIEIHRMSIFSNKTSFVLDPETNFVRSTYPFGLDPIWHLATNGIVFRNSLKMKMSIIFGVTQMMFGLLVGINNIFFFKRYSNIVTLFIPEIIFLSCMFVYLSFLIVYKWIVYGPHKAKNVSPSCAPSILNVFIGMILFTDAPIPPDCKKEMFSHQKIIQIIFLVASLICVPWLFILKPVCDINKKKKEKSKQQTSIRSEDLICSEVMPSSLMCRRSAPGGVTYPHKFHNFRSSSESTSIINVEPYYDFCQKFGMKPILEAEEKRKKSLGRFSFTDKKREIIEQKRQSQAARKSSISKRQSRIYPPNPKSPWEARASEAPPEEESNFDVFIHQAIHSIEFLLGSISNTASYLRLWALSLAHEQLSDVIWQQLFGIALTMESPILQPIAIVILFMFWSVLSVAILVLMEGLSAFLHTLRLHWIEFQSKFYDGNGRIFQPFSFKNILEAA